MGQVDIANFYPFWAWLFLLLTSLCAGNQLKSTFPSDISPGGIGLGVLVFFGWVLGFFC